jgi:lysophospholipase L1-like esterase
MTNPKEDFTLRGLLLLLTTLLVLVIVSFIPPVEAGGLSLRRASVVSDVIMHSDEKASSDEESAPEIDVAEFEIDLEDVADKVAQTTATASPTAADTSASWEGIFDEQPMGESPNEVVLDGLDEPVTESLLAADFSELLPSADMITSIEAFGGEEFSAPFNRLYEKLVAGKQSVRVAFMGDSFVEGDILTADLRELLQDTFGGGGVGFAPMASPFTGFRQTVKTTSKGWTPYNIMQRKNTPEPYVNDYFVSGWVAKASSGASVRWDMSDKRRHLNECRRARIMFICRKEAELRVRLNEGEERIFNFDGGDDVRQIVVEDNQITSLEMAVVSGADGFTGLGADFDSTEGVAVDNFSIRSNNGQAMFWSNPSVNAQVNTMRAYDLVILQYGLNIMQADRHDYSLYAKQVEKMIRFVESCFPGAAVLVMGVSDRSQKNEQGIVPMESAKDLSQWQRTAAEQCGAAFWNTYDAMQKLGGMSTFVDNGWAGKDYTHINYAGGKQVARALYHAILQGAQRYAEQLRERIERSKPVITTPVEIAPLEDKLEIKPLEIDLGEVAIAKIE